MSFLRIGHCEDAICMYLYLRFKKLPCGQNMALHVVCTTYYVLTNSDAMFEKSHLLLIPVYIFTKLISEAAQRVQTLLGVFMYFVVKNILKSVLSIII